VERNQSSQVIAGVLLIALGLIFLGQRLELISGLDLTRLWPLILLVIGAGKFFGPRAEGQPRSGIWLMFLGALFLAHTYRVMTIDRSWPLFIVAGGVSILLGSRNRDGDGKSTAAPANPPGIEGR
jgi:cell wall-active antibiotic response 4TMS protein YvqF